MVDELLSFIEILMAVAPEMAPKIETAIDKWGSVHEVPTDKYIAEVRAPRTDEINERIDDMVDDLDIPED